MREERERNVLFEYLIGLGRCESLCRGEQRSFVVLERLHGEIERASLLGIVLKKMKKNK